MAYDPNLKITITFKVSVRDEQKKTTINESQSITVYGDRKDARELVDDFKESIREINEANGPKGLPGIGK